MRHRHRSFEDLRRAMQAALAAPTVRVGDGVRENPLALMEEVGRNGPLGAILDAWAVTGDVLTFYQERIDDERALSSARETISAYAIARSVGHEPRPAVAANVDLAFSIAPSAQGALVTIPARTAVGNVPAEGALPAIFETDADLPAHAAWNALDAAMDDAPVVTRLAPSATRIVLAGTQPVAPGDAIVLRTGTAGEPIDYAAIVADVIVDAPRDRTLIRWRAPLRPRSGPVLRDVLVLDVRVRPFGALAPPFELASAADRRRYALGGVRVWNGESWSGANDGLDASPFALAASRDGWYGITPGTFVRRAPGEAWTAVTPAPGLNLQSLAAGSSGRIAAGTTTGDVLVSIDDGVTWLRIGGEPAARGARRLPSLPVRGIALDESSDVPLVYVATDRGVASIPLNGDAWSWRNDGFPGTDPKTGYAACAATSIVLDPPTGALFVTTTYGVYRGGANRRWERIEGLGNVAQLAALPRGRFAAAGPGGVFLSDDGGATWTKVLFIDATPRALAADGETIAVGVGCDIFSSHDAGATWIRHTGVSPSRISAVAVDPDGCIAAASPLIDNPAREWPGLDGPLRGTTLWLDRAVMLNTGDVLVIGKDGDAIASDVYHVRASATRMLSAYGMAGIATVVTLDEALHGDVTARDAIVHLGARSREAVRVRRGALAPPSDAIPVRRGVPRLSSGRAAIVEGRAPQAVLRGLAGRSLTIRFAAGVPPAVVERTPRAFAPDLDVDAAIAAGPRGAILARFDGVWQCDDVLAEEPEWNALAPPAFPLTTLASFEGRIYAGGRGEDGVIVYRDDAWHAAGLRGAVRRVLAWDGPSAGVAACLERGALTLRADGRWEPMPGLDAVEVFAIAADSTQILAATSGGVFAGSPAGTWTVLPGFTTRAVNAVAFHAGVAYAGTRGGGTWRLGTGGWEPAAASTRSGDVRALVPIAGASLAAAPSLLAAEHGRGITLDGAPLDAGVATAVAAFIPYRDGNATVVVAFRATPVTGESEGVPMRRWRGAVADDALEVELLDAGMLAPSLRDGLEAVMGAKLDAAEVVVEAQGRAWRLAAGDDLPLVLLRRDGPRRLDAFEVERFDVRARPLPAGAETLNPVLRWELAKGGSASAVIGARADELWYLPARAAAPIVAERARIAVHDAAAVVLREPLRLAFDPRTVTILANVVGATHGATIAADEAIASGDPSHPAQRASLTRKPLTYVMRAGAARPEPAIDIWIRSDLDGDAPGIGRGNADRGLRWRYVRRLTESDRHARTYTLQQRDDGSTTLVFGDGKHGTRLPRGTDNIVARYRFGAGPDGNVAANRLTLLQNVLPNVEKVRNPLAASGGAAADDLADLRRDVPLGMIAFDRIVSRRDLVDFVRAWPGVAKVDVARRLAAGSFVVTYAARDGESVDEAALLAALRANGAFDWSIALVACRKRTFCLAATLYVAAGDGTDRRPPARRALLDAFAFENRILGGDVTAAAAIDVLQRVPGVGAVRLVALYETGTTPRNAETVAGSERPGEPPTLLTIDPDGITLTQEPLVREVRA
jgi:predicted phage baseplate assembly protein